MALRRDEWRKCLSLICLSIALTSCGGGSSQGGAGAESSAAGPPAQGADVVTYHNDNARTGRALSETLLTPANVNAATFGKIGFDPVDGKVDAQPLYLSNVTTADAARHNVLYIATEHDSLYAFDADTGVQLWQISVLGAGEFPSEPRHNCGQVAPEIGITATPVIDRSRGAHGALYLIAMSKDGSGHYFQRLHAIDVATGAELFGGPHTISAAVTNSAGAQVVFDPAQYKERAALLLLNGSVYTAWASHCDVPPYTGWIMGFGVTTLAPTSVLNLTPNGSDGAIWMSGGGLAADSSGSIFLLDGNGTFDTNLDARGFPALGDFGNAFIKLSTAGGLAVTDYFAPFDTVRDSDPGVDVDLGSGEAMVLPDVTDAGGAVRHLAVGAGKDGNIYVVNRDSMGKFNVAGNGSIYQEIAGALLGGVYGAPAYYNGSVYYGAVDNAVTAFAIENGMLSAAPAGETGNVFGYPGASPSISANGSTNGILWAVENTPVAVLHAYDAANLSHELYNSSQAAGGRDTFGAGNKFITPTIANGKVYVGTTNGVAMFGLLP